MANGRQRRIPEVLSAGRFELVDASGRVRAVVGNLAGVGTEWSPGVALYDAEGHERVSLLLTDAGPVLSFAEGGNVVFEQGVFDRDHPGAGPFLVLCDRDGQPGWGVRLDPDGRPTFVPDDG